MKTVLDFLGQLWLRFLKPDRSITVPHPNESKAKRSSDSNSILQKSLETFLQERIEFRFNLLRISIQTIGNGSLLSGDVT